MRIARKQRVPAALAGWYLEPYGAPTASSEVSKLDGFYTVEAMTVFGAAPARAITGVAAGTILPGRRPSAGPRVPGGH